MRGLDTERYVVTNESEPLGVICGRQSSVKVSPKEDRAWHIPPSAPPLGPSEVSSIEGGHDSAL